jgi:hypothetical protein
MAIAGRWLAARYNKPGFEVFDYAVYAVCGEGCLMEGVGAEAASLAGHLGLDNLCWVYDNNHIIIEGSTKITFTEDVAARFLGYRWNVLRVDDANDLERIEHALGVFRETGGRPRLVILDSHIGCGSPPMDAAVRGVPIEVPGACNGDRADAAARASGRVGAGSAGLPGGPKRPCRAGRLGEGAERIGAKRPLAPRRVGRPRAVQQDPADL